MLFAASALFLVIRNGISNSATLTKDVASDALARLPSHATAPIERLAELGWTVTPQPDKLQFSITGPNLPDMALSASLFNTLDRPFTLQLQQLNSLAGLHLLSDNHQCTEIGIGASEFTDTAELGGFTNLTKLVISQTPLNGKGVLDASPLGKLVNLRVLVLNSSRVKDVTFASSLVNLETLNLGETLVTDISAVSALSKLVSFDVRGTRVTDLRPLRQSLALRELEIGGAQTLSLTNLSHLDGLKQLRVIEQGDVDLSTISSLVTLERIFLWGPLHVDANVLRPLKALKDLQISGFGFQQIATTVVNAQAIAELKNLNTLTLGSLRLDTFDFLGSLMSLTTLNLNELPLNSIEPVRKLQALKSISLTSIPVVDITPLVDLPALEEVRIMRTPARSDAVSALERRGVKVIVY
ncbi:MULTISPECIES: leucine-rich repeat domain-containing protein [unclassified Bradyrhizobium]|uniref:leucine-rich repeat domain-containing protein n=1 Tax=unclassified Bradyrhizobium TaxID=2631580 RepID=UPI0028E67F4D|nr:MULTISPECIES: leucine-rich repeat domain-containing protein [unclassified Bradyrhizobium]